MEQRLLTISEVAEITRTPVNTLRYWRSAGEGPKSFRLGRRVVYRSIDVESWIAEQMDVQSRCGPRTDRRRNAGRAHHPQPEPRAQPEKATISVSDTTSARRQQRRYLRAYPEYRREVFEHQESRSTFARIAALEFDLAELPAQVVFAEAVGE